MQRMVFDADHQQFLNPPKGMQVVLQERGLWRSGLTMKCKKKDDTGISCTSNTCCAYRILENQLDFKSQQSLVQETIESLGHLCIFLPKYHCEHNFIEFFWGAVKKYLHDNTNYTFETLKVNLQKAMASVKLETIWKRELRTFWWCEAYRSGLDAKQVQVVVQKFSSKTFKSHRHIAEMYASAFDVQLDTDLIQSLVSFQIRKVANLAQIHNWYSISFENFDNLSYSSLPTTNTSFSVRQIREQSSSQVPPNRVQNRWCLAHMHHSGSQVTMNS